MFTRCGRCRILAGRREFQPVPDRHFGEIHCHTPAVVGPDRLHGRRKVEQRQRFVVPPVFRARHLEIFGEAHHQTRGINGIRRRECIAAVRPVHPAEGRARILVADDIVHLFPVVRKGDRVRVFSIDQRHAVDGFLRLCASLYNLAFHSIVKGHSAASVLHLQPVKISIRP